MRSCYSVCKTDRASFIAEGYRMNANEPTMTISLRTDEMARHSGDLETVFKRVL